MNDSDAQGACPAQVIARSALGAVAVCPGCGNVQLTLEYLTLRLQPAAFRELVDMLVFAQRRIDGDPGLQGATTTAQAPAALASRDEPIH
jgi:hypothetical protein